MEGVPQSGSRFVKQLRWPMLVFVICLPVAVLASGIEIPWLTGASNYAAPMSVPQGDQEVVWLHTTTHAGNWERFVSGVQRATMLHPGMTVDDSQAFREHSTAIPEVVIRQKGQSGRLRIRWYKISSFAQESQWVKALAERKPAPLAIIGGGSTDRARDLAQVMARQTTWQGERPLLLLTTATAESIAVDSSLETNPSQGPGRINLMSIYPERTFRFCFGNRQMAEAMLDFIGSRPELRPQRLTGAIPSAVVSTLSAASTPAHRPIVLTVEWADDPFSLDLLNQINNELPDKLTSRVDLDLGSLSDTRVFRWQVPFSVGGFIRPNSGEERVAREIQHVLNENRHERGLLVLPTITAPARRLLHTLIESEPDIGRRVVVLNGDGIQLNHVLRDGDFAWPVSGLAVPMVLFTHNNPVAWDSAVGSQAPAGYELFPPTSTEDVLHSAEIIRVLVKAAYPPNQTTGPVTDARQLAQRFRDMPPAYFDSAGNRMAGTGEYIVLFKPVRSTDVTGLLNDALLEVWNRPANGQWAMTHALSVNRVRMLRETP